MRDLSHGQKATPDARQFRGTEDPAGVSGHLRGLGRIILHAGRLCRGNPKSPRSDPSLPARARLALDIEVVVCCNPGELDLPGWEHPVVDASGGGSADLQACPPSGGAVIPNSHRVVAARTRA